MWVDGEKDACMRVEGQESGMDGGMNGWLERWGILHLRTKTTAGERSRVPPLLSLSGPAAPIPTGPREEDPERSKIPLRRCLFPTFSLVASSLSLLGPPG